MKRPPGNPLTDLEAELARLKQESRRTPDYGSRKKS